MKSFITAVFIYILTFPLFAQNDVNVNIIIPPPFTPFLSAYTNFTGQNVITLTNTTANPLQVKLIGTITGEDNGLFLFTKPTYMPAAPIILAPFQTYTVTASTPSKDFLSDANTESNVSQQQRDAILASGVLPEGNYKVCVRAVDYITNQPYSPEDPSGCTNVIISFPLSPILLNPLCHSEVQNPYPSFNWTPVISNGSFFVYDLYILRLLETQIPDDAMWLAVASNVGNPYKISNLVAPVYQFKPFDIPLQAGAQYAWCVVARDIAGQIAITNQGRSEVCTFTFTPPSSVVPPITEAVMPVGFTYPPFFLNNSSISGRLLYRYHKNENFGDPGSPLYSPSLTVYGEPKNAQELQLMGGSTESAPVVNGEMNLSQTLNGSVSTQGYQNLFQQQSVDRGGAVFQPRIQIDPTKKTLYENTLSLVNAEPLRQTSISLYLEYVAVKRVEEGNNSYFQVIPLDQLVFNRRTISDHDGFMDPQIYFAAQQAGLSPGVVNQLRTSGSELLATAITDNDGNYTFNFDLAENTGLLQAGPMNLKYFIINKPNIVDEQIFVHPLDMISNPVQNAITPGVDVLNQMNDVVNGVQVGTFGNTMLQGNQGWGATSQPIQGTSLQGGSNLNQQLNKQLNQSGPNDVYIWYPDEANLIEWRNFTAHSIFKVLRIRVNENYYCHPDVLIFGQPGEHLSIPPSAVFVNSFNAEIKLIAGGKKEDGPLLPPGQPISDFNLKFGRLKTFWDGRAHNFPLNEGMGVNPESYFQIAGATPYFMQWNQNHQKPGILKFTSDGMTDNQGKILIERLVKNKHANTSDAHYFEVVYPLTSTYNYSGSWGSIRLNTLGYYDSYTGETPIQSSYNFVPPVYKQDVKLEPLNPELLVRTVVTSNIEKVGLSNVDIYMYEYNRNNNANTFTYSTFRTGKTDANGYRRFTNLATSLNAAGGVENPYRRVICAKHGYKGVTLPTNTLSPGNIETNYYQPAKKGQRLDLNEVEMVGGSKVFGYVKDEFNNPVISLVKIGDGPFFMTSNTFAGSGFDSQVHSNGGNIPPVVQSGGINTSNLFGMLDAGLLGGTNNSSPAYQIPTMNQSAGTNATLFDPSIGLVGGISYQESTVDPRRVEYSRFNLECAVTGSSTRVIIIPLSDQYFADTFYVNIPLSTAQVNIGTFQVYEKAHRVSIRVKREDAGGPVAASNAFVEVGEVSGITNNQGVLNLRFTTPDAYFRVFIRDGNRVPIEVHRHIPISKNYQAIEFLTRAGKSVSGVVVDAATQQPIANARVFAQTGISEYGQSVVQTFTNAQGQFSLQGIPMNQNSITAVKSGGNPTYIGLSRTIPINTNVPIQVRFELQKLPNINLAKIYGFDVEISSVLPGGDDYLVTGAFINIPQSGNFKLYNPAARVRFANIRVRRSSLNDSNGVQFGEGVADEVRTLEQIVRLRLFDQYIVDMRTDQLSGLPMAVVVEKRDNLEGSFRGRVLTDLESFRFSFNYSGKFYISTNKDNLSMTTLYSKPQQFTHTEYFVMDQKINNIGKDIQFTIHNFKAKADREFSKIRAANVRLATTLLPELQLAGKIEVDAGFISVTPQTISIANPGHQLSFNLEKWQVSSLQGWNYSIPHGGIIIPKARIQTELVDIPVNNLILRPNELIMPSEEVDLNNLLLGGGVTKLQRYAGTQAIMNFDPACSFDLGPHWRFSVFKTPSSSPACYISGLPGFIANDKIDIGSFTIYSNNSTLVQPINQQKKIYNIVDISIQNIKNTKDAVEIAGALITGIPGVTPPTVIFEYVKPGASIIRRTKAIGLVMETPGKIFFNGDVGDEFYKLENNYFEANGRLVFENEDMNDGKFIDLRGRLIKTPTSITLSIPKLKNDNSATAFQYIPLEGGGTRLKVLSGEQRVVGGAWNVMKYKADLLSTTSTDGLQQRELEYMVSGAVEVVPDGTNSLKVDKIETPLGGMTMVFDWQKGSFLGTLNFNIPIQMGAIQIDNGMFECMFSGEGFYFDLMGEVTIPGLSEVLSVNVGFLTGYYPKLPVTVIKRHSDIMYLLGVPEYLNVDGIKGVYINANAAPPIANWSVNVPLPLFSVGFGVNAGVDFNFLLNFGNTTSIMAIEAAAYAKAWAGVQVLACTFCVGALATFLVDGKLTFAPQMKAEFNTCASFTVFGEFCTVEASKSIGCRAKASSSNGLDIELQWSACGGKDADKMDASCDF